MSSTEGERLDHDYSVRTVSSYSQCQPVTIPCVPYMNRIRKGPPCNHTYDFTHKGRRGVNLQAALTCRRPNDFMDTSNVTMVQYGEGGEGAKFTYRFEPEGRLPYRKQMYATVVKNGIRRMMTTGKAAIQAARFLQRALRDEPLLTTSGQQLAFEELHLTRLEQHGATLVIELCYYDNKIVTTPLPSVPAPPPLSLPPSLLPPPPLPPISIPPMAQPTLVPSPEEMTFLVSQHSFSSTPRISASTFAVAAAAQHDRWLDNFSSASYTAPDAHIAQNTSTCHGSEMFSPLPATSWISSPAASAQPWAFSDGGAWATSSTTPQLDCSSVPRQVWAPWTSIQDPALCALEGLDAALGAAPPTSTFFGLWTPSPSSESTCQELDAGFFNAVFGSIATAEEVVADPFMQAYVSQQQIYHYYPPFDS